MGCALIFAACAFTNHAPYKPRRWDAVTRIVVGAVVGYACTQPETRKIEHWLGSQTVAPLFNYGHVKVQPPRFSMLFCELRFAA